MQVSSKSTSSPKSPDFGEFYFKQTAKQAAEYKKIKTPKNINLLENE